ncbi:MAG: insulinase family protein [Gemmatimonadales bacterium]|jgi:predicted Zn-dependent peptidase
MPLRPARFPAFAKGTLPNGVNMIIVEHHKQPVVTVTLALPAGASYVAADKTGLDGIVAEVLTKGTESRAPDQIAAEVEGLGGSISAYSDNDFLRITVSALAENLPQAMNVLADVVMHSTFPAREVELARTRALSALQIDLSEPGAIAQRAFSHEVYGDHPYGRNYTATTLRAITRDDVVGFYDAHVKPQGALLVVAGDVSAAAVRSLAEQAFARWQGAPAPAPAFPAIPARTSTEIVLVHKAGAVQSNILAGFTMITPRDPAVYPLTIMNQILGGGSDARLFLILREQKSWTYGSYSRFTRPLGLGMFVANAEVRTPVTDSALAELLHQLDRMRNEVPADSEIAAAKNYLVGNFPLTIETPEQIADAVASARLRGLPDDYVPRFRDRLAAVTRVQLGAADKRFFTTDKMVIVVVGDGTKILGGLKRLGSVRIVDVEGKPVSEADLTAAPTAVAWAPDRLVPGSFTYRVMVQGNAMGQASSAMERATEGDRQVLRLTSTMNLGGMVSQNDTVTVDAATLAPMHLREGGSQGGQPMSMVLDYQGTHLTGHVHVPSRQGVRDAAVDTTLAEGTLDQNVFSALLTALPLASGAHWLVNAYDGTEGVVRPLTATVVGEDSVTVPAGAFACWKLALTGGQFPINFYITKAAPYLIAKYELVGPPVVFELTAKTP